MNAPRDTPRVSLLLPVYNGEDHLHAAIESILNQSFTDFELLVIDDGSRDGTQDIIAQFTDSRIRPLHQENRGLIASLNRGFDLVRAPYVARMDHDDISLPERLERQVAFLDRNPAVAAVGCFFAQMDEEGRRLNEAVRLPTEHARIRETIRSGKLALLHSTIMFRRSSLGKGAIYDPDFHYSEDVELLARMSNTHRLANIEYVGYLWRIRLDSVCNSRAKRQRANERLVRKMLARHDASGDFSLTPAERTSLRRLNHRKAEKEPDRSTKAFYHCRVGRALLRSNHRIAALQEYSRSILHNPFQWLAYTGVLRAFLP